MSKPRIIIITGLPCTGKSTIGKKIADKFKLPFIHKDGIKELLFDTLGWKDRKWSKKLSEASYELLFYYAEVMLQAQHSFIIESNFQPDVHVRRFQQLSGKYPLEILQIICLADGKRLFQRFIERFERGERHPGHVDETTFNELRPSLEQGCIEPMALKSQIIKIDTTHFEQIDYKSLFMKIDTFRNTPDE